MTTREIDAFIDKIHYVMGLYNVEGRVTYNTLGGLEFVIENFMVGGGEPYDTTNDFVWELGLVLNEHLSMTTYLYAYPDIEGRDISILVTDH